MVRKITLLWMLSIACVVYAQDNLSALIPMPNKISGNGCDVLELKGEKASCYVETGGLEAEFQTLASILGRRLGIEVEKSYMASKADVRLLVDKSLARQGTLSVEGNERAIDSQGSFFGGSVLWIDDFRPDFGR